MLPKWCSRIIDNKVHAFYILRLLCIFVNRLSKVRGTKHKFCPEN
jgi:hypothetical protein